MIPTKDDIGKLVRVHEDIVGIGDYAGETGTIVAIYPAAVRVQFPQFRGNLPNEENSEFLHLWFEDVDIVAFNSNGTYDLDRTTLRA